MFEIFVFLIVLAVLRAMRRRVPTSVQNLTIHVYHHWDGGGGEQLAQAEPPPLSGNVVPLHRVRR